MGSKHAFLYCIIRVKDNLFWLAKTKRHLFVAYIFQSRLWTGSIEIARGSMGEEIVKNMPVLSFPVVSSEIHLFTIATVMIWGKRKEKKKNRATKGELACSVHWKQRAPKRPHKSFGNLVLATDAVKMAQHDNVPNSCHFNSLLPAYIHKQKYTHILFTISPTVTGDKLLAQSFERTALIPLIFCFFQAGSTIYF